MEEGKEGQDRLQKIKEPQKEAGKGVKKKVIRVIPTSEKLVTVVAERDV